MNIPYLYDAGILIAVDNDDRRIRARHSLALAWRDSRRQVRLGKFLTGRHVVPIGLETAKAAGILCGEAGVPPTSSTPPS